MVTLPVQHVVWRHFWEGLRSGELIGDSHQVVFMWFIINNMCLLEGSMWRASLRCIYDGCTAAAAWRKRCVGWAAAGNSSSACEEGQQRQQVYMAGTHSLSVHRAKQETLPVAGDRGLLKASWCGCCCRRW